MSRAASSRARVLTSLRRKALKVVDLKDILTKASVAIPSKANKPDLIAKILASPAAVDVYNQQHGTSSGAAKPAPKAQEKPPAVLSPHSAPAPPSPAKAANPAATAPPAAAKPVSQAAPKQAALESSNDSAPSSTLDSDGEATKAPEDEEAERRKARAARFGIPVVEPTKPKEKRSKPVANGKAAKGAAPSSEDAEKLAARRARFGIKDPIPDAAKSTGTSNGRKRPAPPSEPVDEEELARRKRRAERFGIPMVVRFYPS
ncbi:hypothetical protein C2E23DRAFT_724870 [Lenzites betulinus]|nr:hypothetical protein C2E23DRAFT_724870 [Lenzites betulinus]